MNREHYIRSAAAHRSHVLRHALIHPYLGDNGGVRCQLAEEIDDLEYRLHDLERDPQPPSLELILTCREMLYARRQLYKEIS